MSQSQHLDLYIGVRGARRVEKALLRRRLDQFLSSGLAAFGRDEGPQAAFVVNHCLEENVVFNLSVAGDTVVVRRGELYGLQK